MKKPLSKKQSEKKSENDPKQSENDPQRSENNPKQSKTSTYVWATDRTTTGQRCELKEKSAAQISNQFRTSFGPGKINRKNNKKYNFGPGKIGKK